MTTLNGLPHVGEEIARSVGHALKELGGACGRWSVIFRNRKAGARDDPVEVRVKLWPAHVADWTREELFGPKAEETEAAQELEALLPAHAAGLELTHDPHKMNMESIESWESWRKAACHQDGAGPVTFGWASVEQRDKALATDSFWECQWYPRTSVCFERKFAADLGVLLAACREPSQQERSS